MMKAAMIAVVHRKSKAVVEVSVIDR